MLTLIRDCPTNCRRRPRALACGRAGVAAAAMVIAAAAAQAQSAGADGTYRGRIRCAAIPSLTVAPVDVEFTMTIRGATATYQRPVLSYDGRQTVGQENGTGTVGTDGAVVLQGGVSGSLGVFVAHYTGRLSGAHLDLSGTESFTAPRQYERSCTISLDRG
jgi:hypothetical protein